MWGNLRRHFQFGLIFIKNEPYYCPSTFYFRLKSWFIFWGLDYPTFLTDKGDFFPFISTSGLCRDRFWHIFGFEIFRIKPLNHNRNLGFLESIVQNLVKMFQSVSYGDASMTGQEQTYKWIKHKSLFRTDPRPISWTQYRCILGQ